MEKNQRRESRVSAKSQLNIIFSKIPVVLNTCEVDSVLDLSSIGIKVEASEFEAKVGDIVTVSMVVNDRPIRTKGNIKFRKDHQYGIEFLRLQETDRKLIKTLKISSVNWRWKN